MSALSSVSSPYSTISPDLELSLKKHLITFTKADGGSIYLGEESDLIKTALKITTNETISNYFKQPKLTNTTMLPEGNYLVLCAESEIHNSSSIYTVYTESEIKKWVRANKLHMTYSWKVLEIPQDLLIQLQSEIDVAKNSIYLDPTRHNIDTVDEENDDFFVYKQMTSATQAKGGYCTIS